jgi:hypothetical protein
VTALATFYESSLRASQKSQKTVFAVSANERASYESLSFFRKSVYISPFMFHLNQNFVKSATADFI